MNKITLLITLLITLTNANNFQTLYKKNKKEGIGNYITIDFILNNLYLHKKEIVADIEQKELEPNLKKFSYLLLHQAVGKKVKDDKLLVYLTTLNMLQNNALPSLPTYVIEEAKRELGKINGASTKRYEKFKNSGRLRDKKSYFNSLTFMTQMPFYLNASSMTQTDENGSLANVKRGLILSDVIGSNSKLKKLYEQIDRTLNALFGESDDLSVGDFFRFGLSDSVDRVKSSLNKKENYPKIIGSQVDIRGVNKSQIAKNMLSFRLFSSRYTLDSYLFSRVVFPYTLAPLHGKADKYASVVGGKLVRTLPSIRDIELLFNPPKKETYVNYFKNLKLVQKDLKHLRRPKSLYAYDFLIYKELLRVKKVNAFRGYYTQNRHLAYAYLKKSHTPTQRSMSLGMGRDKALLEKKITDVLGLIGDELNFLYKIDKDERTLAFAKAIKLLKKISIKKVYSDADIETLNSLEVRFSNSIRAKFKPLGVELHRDGNSGQSLMQSVKKPTVVKKSGFRGAIYTHEEYLKLKEKK